MLHNERGEGGHRENFDTLLVINCGQDRKKHARLNSFFFLSFFFFLLYATTRVKRLKESEESAKRVPRRERPLLSPCVINLEI